MNAVERRSVGLLCILALAAGFGLGTAHSAPQWWAWLIRVILLVNFTLAYRRAT